MRDELFYIGLMSGTSVDGVDVSLIKTDGKSAISLIEDFHFPYEKQFQNEIKALFSLEFNSGILKLERELTKIHIDATLKLLSKVKFNQNDIRAAGFHGQTIYHNANESITWQIGNPFMFAAATGIRTIYDFRKRDIEYGGQGAPLIPIFHKALMFNEQHPVAVINIGGVANITYINNNDDLIAFDTGPGNALIDDACLKYFNQPYDKNGEIAKLGQVDMDFVNNFLKQEYFYKPYPKSLDRNQFKYITSQINLQNHNDIIATLTYLTATSIACSVKQLPIYPKKLYICGGGARNIYLKNLISDLVNREHKCDVLDISKKSDILNLNSDFIESQGFAYLAARFCNNLPSAFPSTTGALKENICGAFVDK